MNNEGNIETILQKYFTNESNRDELNKAMNLFSDPFHNLMLQPILYEQWKIIEKKTDIYPGLKDPEAILDTIHHRINLKNAEQPKNLLKKSLLNVLKIAAILVIGFLTGIQVNNFQKNETVWCTFTSPKGSISQMVLPDSTMVYINSGSELRYPIDNDHKIREVFLTGEAWFNVTQNKKQPFLVHTPGYDVQVLGTQFNVKAYPYENEIITTLEEGRLWIISLTKEKMNQSQMLCSGQQLIYNVKNELASIREVNPRIYTSWKDNKLIFINMELKELIVLLERKYGVDIEVLNTELLDYHYDGTIKNETILEVLDLLSETLPISYKIEEQKVIIVKNK